MMNRILIVLISALLVAGCGTGSNNGQAAERSKEDVSESAMVGENADPRDAYYKPYEVFENLGGVGGKLVADLAPGDGYFTKKLLNAGARVIAICDTQDEVDALAATLGSAANSDDLTIRLRGMSPSGLSAGEVDRVILSGGFSESEADAETLAKSVYAGIRKGGLFAILEWKPIDTPIGPPVDTRVDVNTAMDILDLGGFTDISGLTKLLPYHNLLVAMEFQGELPS